MKIKTKNLKPTDIDLHLKYLCPQCGQTHWLSLRETQTVNFKVVCDCDAIFKVKKINSIQILYDEASSITKEQEKPQEISQEILQRAVKVFIQYGFTKNEAEDLIIKTYKTCKIEDVSILVKKTLEGLREINVS